MKFLLTILMLPLFILSSTTQNDKVVGKWIGEDQNEVGYVLFDQEGYAAFEFNGQVMGSKSFILNGEKGKMTYTVDFTTTPIEIDLTLTKLETGESKQLLAIADFTDSDTMNFNLAINGERPTTFDENAIVLRRVK